MDLTAPSVSYTVPESLKVGDLVDMSQVTDDTDIASSTLDGSPPSGVGFLNFPPGLIGYFVGNVDAANSNPTTVTVTVTDTAGNSADVSVTFPLVAKGDQNLRFFYSPRTVALGGPAPPLRGPFGAHGTVTYSAMPETVCTVDAMSGALTLVGVGDCVVTATAADHRQLRRRPPPTPPSSCSSPLWS